MTSMMSSNKGKRPLRHLTAGDKIEAIQRIHDGESKASVARDIGVPESTLRGWCKNEQKLRYMSQQTGPDCKLSVEKLTEKMADDAALAAAAVGMLGAPPEKRAKMDTSMPLNFTSNGKLKYDDLGYKGRSSLSALDFSSSGDNGLGSLSFNGLGPSDYSAYKTPTDLSSMNGKSKDYNAMKGYGADLSKPNDPTKADLSMAAISPLTSLSHLSGMSGLAQSPLGLSFNEIASNLNLIAQLNNQSNLGSMAGLGNLNNSLNSSPQNNGLRAVRPKPLGNHTTRSDMEKNQQSLTVKNLAKLQQKTTSLEHISGNGADALDKAKKMATASINRDAPVDDALWYWLKSQQAMLGLNNLYSSSMPTNSASPHRSSPLQQQSQPHHQSMMPTSTTTPPPVSTTPQTTSSTPSGTSDDTKNSSWFWQWYKTFGASLMADKQNAINNNKPIYENILYSQLTKEHPNSTTPPTDAINNNLNLSNKPEDLSRPSVRHTPETTTPETINRSSPRPPLPSQPIALQQQLEQHQSQLRQQSPLMPLPMPMPLSLPPLAPMIISTPSPIPADKQDENEKNQTNVRTVLDNLLYNNNNNNVEVKSESDDSDVSGPSEAVEHGEKFLKWLETCSDPSITAMQVMQFRTLLNTIKMSADRANNPLSMAGGDERSRIRRRK